MLGEPIVAREGTTGIQEEANVAGEKHTDTSEITDTMYEVSAFAAVDPAAADRETAHASGNPDTTVRVAAWGRRVTGNSARVSANSSADTDTIGSLPPLVDQESRREERPVRDTSGIAETMPPRPDSGDRRTPRHDPQTPQTSANTDMMASEHGDTSGNADMTATDTSGDVKEHSLALPCQVHAH